MIVSGKVAIRNAFDNNYALPAFGFVNLEGAKAIINAAEELNSPVIMQMTGGGINFGGHEELFAIAQACAHKASIPVVIHLDHGKSIDVVQKSVDLGFTSVMYDGSEYSIEVNCENSKKARHIARGDVALEVEVGVIGGKEDDVEAESTIFANIDDIKLMNETANPDQIAVAVGTSHGLYHGDININYQLIEDAKRVTNKPIVLHGSSGVEGEKITKAVFAGINKVNFDTELKKAYIDQILKYMETNQNEVDIRKILQGSIDDVELIVKERILQCLANGKADLF